MAVVDTNYGFVYADIGSYGKDCDLPFLNDLRCRRQFRQICWNYPVRDLFQDMLRTSVQTNMLELPGERPLSGYAEDVSSNKYAGITR